jgi:hypothetical protein
MDEPVVSSLAIAKPRHCEVIRVTGLCAEDHNSTPNLLRSGSGFREETESSLHFIYAKIEELPNCVSQIDNFCQA